MTLPRRFNIPNVKAKPSWLAERTLWTLGLALIITLGIGYLRKDLGEGPPDYRLIRDRLNWQHCADLALAGNSRINHDVAPAVLSREMRGLRACNFGFSGNGFSPAYLQHVHRLLDPQSSNKIIVLGITPHSLTPGACRQNGYFAELDRARQTYLPPPWIDDFCRRWVRLRPGNLLRSVFQKKCVERSPLKIFPDGWATIVDWSLDPQSTLNDYRNLFRNNQVSPDIEKQLIEQVDRWCREGIAVFAFRPPTIPEMVELESQLSGFNEEQFKTAFTAVGGIWIPVEPFAYPCIDGSHMSHDAALRFSRDLAEKMKSALETRVCTRRQLSQQ